MRTVCTTWRGAKNVGTGVTTGVKKMTVYYKNIHALSQGRLAMNKSFFAAPACTDGGGGVWNHLLKHLLHKILRRRGEKG